MTAQIRINSLPNLTSDYPISTSTLYRLYSCILVPAYR